MEVLLRWKCHLAKEECADCNGMAYHERWIALDCLHLYSAFKYVIFDRRFLLSREQIHKLNSVSHRPWAKA